MQIGLFIDPMAHSINPPKCRVEGFSLSFSLSCFAKTMNPEKGGRIRIVGNGGNREFSLMSPSRLRYRGSTKIADRRSPEDRSAELFESDLDRLNNYLTIPQYRGLAETGVGIGAGVPVRYWSARHKFLLEFRQLSLSLSFSLSRGPQIGGRQPQVNAGARRPWSPTCRLPCRSLSLYIR